MEEVVSRPWGTYQTIYRGDTYQVKRIVVLPHQKLSLQSHNHRSEHWLIVEGNGVVTLNEKTIEVSKDDRIYIPVKAIHRMANETDKDSFVIDGVLQTVDTFRPYNIKWAFTWDIRLGFEIPLYSRNILFVNLDIYNVLDAKNIAIASVAYSTQAGTTAIPIYEVGRQFWLEVGYRF